jgi:glycosyltransferase involved in cell wall biosynthesis
MSKRKKRILVVGISNSIHTARWLSQINDQGWDIYLFPATKSETHPDVKNTRVFSPSAYHAFVGKRRGAFFLHYPWLWVLSYLDKRLASRFPHRFHFFWSIALAWTIRMLKPDIVQSLEIQHAGYLTLEAKLELGDDFPTWIVTNWGSDIYLFGRLEEHKRKIQSILALCDYYSSECQRDVELARQLGYRGKVLPVFPNAGGYRLDHLPKLEPQSPISARRIILLKGYQGWAGRALVGLRALAHCADVLRGYSVAIYLAGEDVQIAARLFSLDTGIPVEFVPQCSHEEMLRWYGRARIYIGLSISDAISTSLLESMIMGAFPVQSNTACVGEWIEHGRSGFHVPPEDPDVIAGFIREAVLNDSLVDSAAEINAEVARVRLDASKIKSQVVEMYKQILADIKGR